MIPLAAIPSREWLDENVHDHGEEPWAWGELDRRSAACAAWLRSKGVNPNHLVAFALRDGSDLFGLTFGVDRAAATPASLSAKLTPVDREAILDPECAGLPAGVEGEMFAALPGGWGSQSRDVGVERRAAPDGSESVDDIGRVDEDGHLFLAERRADLIVTSGANCRPAEVEAAVLRHPGVRSCAVIGLVDDDLGQRVQAELESDDPHLSAHSFGLFLVDHLSRDKRPRSQGRIETPVRRDARKVRKISPART
jgi:bile acid-coenzyme A ligase